MDIAIISAGFSGGAGTRLVQCAAPGTASLLGHARPWPRRAYGTVHDTAERARLRSGYRPAAPAAFADWLELKPHARRFPPRMPWRLPDRTADAAITGRSRNVQCNACMPTWCRWNG